MRNDTWKNKALVVGGALGTLVGIGAAMLYIRAEEDALEKARNTPVQHKPTPPSAFLPIAIGVLGVLRQIARLSERD